MTTSMDCLPDIVHCKVRGVWGRARPGNVILNTKAVVAANNKYHYSAVARRAASE